MARKSSVSRRRQNKRVAETETETDQFLIELGCEMWQLCNNAKGWVEKLGDRHQRRANNQINWGRDRLDKILEKRNIKLHDLTGQIWREGDPVEIVDAPSEARSGDSVVKAVLEPVVMQNGKLVRRGKVTVGTHCVQPTPSTSGENLLRSGPVKLPSKS